MRTLKKNKQIVYYALKTEKEAEESEEKIIVDGVEVSVDEGDYRIWYSIPEEFSANISFSSGDTQDVEFGLDISGYDAIIVTDLKALPITETSLIWFETEPPTAENDGSTADYSVIAVRHSLNYAKAILKRRVKNGD
jgi:hypothetical protein